MPCKGAWIRAPMIAWDSEGSTLMMHEVCGLGTSPALPLIMGNRWTGVGSVDKTRQDKKEKAERSGCLSLDPVLVTSIIHVGRE